MTSQDNPLLSTVNSKSFGSHLVDQEFAKRFLEFTRVVSVTKSGLRVHAISTTRSPNVQGRMWCSSRSETEIARRISLLQGAGVPMVAACLNLSNSLTARPTTTRLPGMSWHNLGKAADFVLLANDDTIWRGGVMSEVCDLALQCGLQSAHTFAIAREVGHVQLHRGSPLEEVAMGSWPGLEDALVRFWKGK